MSEYSVVKTSNINIKITNCYIHTAAATKSGKKYWGKLVASGWVNKEHPERTNGKGNWFNWLFDKELLLKTRYTIEGSLSLSTLTSPINGKKWMTATIFIDKASIIGDMSKPAPKTDAKVKEISKVTEPTTKVDEIKVLMQEFKTTSATKEVTDIMDSVEKVLNKK